MLERDIEDYLRDKVKGLGGTAYKFISPGHSGVPDRLVCLPGGWVFFVELKTPKGVLTGLQKHAQYRLRELGMQVYTLNSYEAVDEFIEGCKPDPILGVPED